MATQAKNQMTKKVADSGSDQVDYAALSAVVGEPVTPEAVSDAQSSLDAVNLDELVAPTVHVAIMERAPHPVTLPDGSEGARYTRERRVAEITLFPSVKTQIKALAFQRGRRDTPLEDQVPLMLALILEVWRESEPDMTYERLENGLDMLRISKLFQMLFPQASHR